mmetsp:Transcript_26331/g.40837  ORF Transcript_26331/g.40837 Transcript_26331/m.40837 type:complete len:83 (-) Transcript_26331:13-261(-)
MAVYTHFFLFLLFLLLLLQMLLLLLVALGKKVNVNKVFTLILPEPTVPLTLSLPGLGQQAKALDKLEVLVVVLVVAIQGLLD